MNESRKSAVSCVGLRAGLAGVALGALMLQGTPALGQVASNASKSDAAASPAAAAGPDDAKAWSDIVVTARFRSERVQDSPLAITALNSDTLAARGILKVSDLGNAAPNVTIQPSPANSGKSAYTLIRGVGQTDFNFAFEPGVALYIDEVYLGTVFGSQLDLMDTGQIEVLRGPQGTLFGRNSEGGAIRISSMLPKGDNSGYVEASYGSFDRRRVRAALDMALVPDRVLLRIAGGINKSNGYVELIDFACANPSQAGNLAPQTTKASCKVGTLGGDDTKFAQGTLRLNLSDRLRVDVRGSYLDDRGENVPQTLLIVANADPSAPPFTVPGQLAILDQRAIANPRIGVPFDGRFVTGDFYKAYSASSNLLSNRVYTNEAPVEAWSASGVINWEFVDGLTLHSVTAYQRYKGVVSDPGSAPLYTGSAIIPVRHNQFSQEISLSGKASVFARPLEWVVGGFLYNGNDRQLGFNDIELVPLTGLHFGQNDPSSNRSRSLFAHILYHATDKLGLEVGYRYSFERKRYTFNHYLTADFSPAPVFTIPAGAPFVVGGAEDKTQRGDPRVAINYQWTPQLMTYVSYSTGYKSGGVNPRPTTSADITAFGPETVKAYELGAKTQTRDRRLQFNVALYQSDYNGLQISASSGGAVPTFRYSNVGSARIRGFEVEANARPVEGLSFNAALGYTDFKILDLGAAAGVAGGPTLSSKPILVPTWNGTVGVQYKIDSGTIGSFTPRLETVFQSHVFTDADNTRAGRIPARALVNARLEWKTPLKGFDVALLVTNLLDKKHYLNLQNELDATATLRGQPGAPRQFLLTGRFEF